MRGLRTQENPEFMNYWKMVQEKAGKQNKMFFCDAGEGREYFADDIEAEDLSGWLIPNELVSKFEQEWEEDSIDQEAWSDFICFAEWKLNGNQITVEFVEY